MRHHHARLLLACIRFLPAPAAPSAAPAIAVSASDYDAKARSVVIRVTRIIGRAVICRRISIARSISRTWSITPAWIRRRARIGSRAAAPYQSRAQLIVLSGKAKRLRRVGGRDGHKVVVWNVSAVSGNITAG